MLDPELKEKMSAAYAKIGEIGFYIATNIKKGKDHSKRQEEYWRQGIFIQELVKLLYRHVDANTTPPTLYNITEVRVNKIIRLLDQLGKLSRFPIFPTVLPTAKPVVFNRGNDGTNGVDGTDGTDANIDCQPALGENELQITSAFVAGVKTFFFDIQLYKAPTIGVVISGSTVVEKGVVIASHNITITTTKGSRTITALSMINPSTLDAALQSVLDFVTINGAIQPVVNFISNTNISSDITYIVGVNDGQSVTEGQASINFYFPYLYGATSSDSITHYTALTKLIAGKANRSFNLNGTDQFFWIGYPASYGAVARIKDQNGFVVTAAFTEIIVNVTSVGLDVNWTESYRFYRTTLKTDINNAPFSIEF